MPVINISHYIELPEICTVHLINDGVTVFGDSATVEFASTGPTTSFVCSLDRQAFTPCMDLVSYVRIGLSSVVGNTLCIYWLVYIPLWGYIVLASH